MRNIKITEGAAKHIINVSIVYEKSGYRLAKYSHQSPYTGRFTNFAGVYDGKTYNNRKEMYKIMEDEYNNSKE